MINTSIRSAFYFLARSLKTFLMAAPIALFLYSPANGAVISAYFGWNYAFLAPAGGNPAAPLVMQLTGFTYDGGAGLGLLSGPIPAFGGLYPLGMPDGIGYVATPTFTTAAGGDGETTRTIGTLIPIDWNPAGAAVPYSLAPLAFPSIGITAFTTDYGTYSGFPLTAAGTSHYIVGLIPPASGTELLSVLVMPQGDIYNPGAGGGIGNPTLSATDIGVGPGAGDLITVTFAASAVPVPAAVWLFGSGLLGLIGMARRKQSK